MKTKPLSDELLISRIARGDTGALEILYDRHAAMVLGILVRTLGERAAAEVLLQETFFQVWKGAGTYSPKTSSLPGWLYQIARRLAVAETDGK